MISTRPYLTLPPVPGSDQTTTDSPSVWETLATALSPAAQYPRLIAGIESTRHPGRDGDYAVIKNPAAGTYLKLQIPEYELLAIMDGTRSTMELVIEFFRRHRTFAAPRIIALVDRLGTEQFLTEPSSNIWSDLGATLARRPSFFQRLSRLPHKFIYSEVSIQGVDDRLDRWQQLWGWFFFTPAAVIAGILLAIVGPALLVLESLRGRYRVTDAGGWQLALLMLLGFAALFIHEIGHGLAVKHAHRFVRRAGLLLYYGFPAAFVDTTDIWMAPRRQRLITSLAGPWTGILLGGLGAIAVVLLPRTPVGAFLYGWTCVFLLVNLSNFNPLLELDGYYMLVDILDKPLLRPRALAFAAGPMWKKLWRRETFTPEEKLFAAFGLVSAAFSGLMILLGLRFWHDWIWPALRHALASTHGFWRTVLLLAVSTVSGTIVIALAGAARPLAGALRRRWGWLRGRLDQRWHADALNALRAVEICKTMPDPRLLDIARAMRPRTVTAGNVIVSQGKTGEEFYLIADGLFQVLVDGRPVATLTRGNYFGELALLHNAPRAATVIATQNGRLFVLGRSQFDGALSHDLATREKLQAASTYREEIARLPLFADLSPVEMDLLLSRLEPGSAQPAQEIIHQGDPGDRFYIIRSGTVQVLRDSRQIATLGPGESFGEIALLANVPRVATVVAQTKVEFLSLSAPDFHDLLSRYAGRSAQLHELQHQRMNSINSRTGTA